MRAAAGCGRKQASNRAAGPVASSCPGPASRRFQDLLEQLFQALKLFSISEQLGAKHATKGAKLEAKKPLAYRYRQELFWPIFGACGACFGAVNLAAGNSFSGPVNSNSRANSPRSAGPAWPQARWNCWARVGVRSGRRPDRAYVLGPQGRVRRTWAAGPDLRGPQGLQLGAAQLFPLLPAVGPQALQGQARNKTRASGPCFGLSARNRAAGPVRAFPPAE